MEAATAASGLSERLRARRLEREFERLRPLGEAYLLRRFDGQISRADAEDAVAEVLARLHGRIVVGKAPENLRATFLTAARNAVIDQLRARALRPTAPLEAAAEATDPSASPSERAEGREDSVRLQEMLARMRARYGEALMLHYGLGMTVPQISCHLGISRPAAKKLMLRAVREARERMMEIEGAEVCPQMRGLAWRSLLDKEASELASDAEAEALRAHFGHCGACRSFLAKLRERLHELGSVAVLGLAAGDCLGEQSGIGAHLGQWAGTAVQGAEAAVEKARQLALRASGSFSSGEGAAGALAGAGQKVVAICGTASAATATCLITGAVGPGLGAGVPSGQVEPALRVKSSPALTRQIEPAPEPAAPAPVEPIADPAPLRPTPDPEPAPVDEALPPAPPELAVPAAPPPEPPPSEFGLEGGRSESPQSAAPVAPPASSEAGAAPAAPPSPSGPGSDGSAGVGFQG